MVENNAEQKKKNLEQFLKCLLNDSIDVDYVGGKVSKKVLRSTSTSKVKASFNQRDKSSPKTRIAENDL